MAKEAISKIKRQPSEWEKLIANETTDKGLISKMYKHIIFFFQYQKNKQPNQKKKRKGRRSKQTFLQRIHADGQ